MKRSILGVAALLALALVGSASADSMTFADAKALAASEGKPLLVDFYATW